MELATIKIKNLVKFTESLIEFDNKELIKMANDLTSKYKGLIVTEDDTADMKKVCAELNKLITSLEDERKDIGKDYSKPLKDFEGKIKEVTTIISEVRSGIDSQLKAFDQARRNEQLELIKPLLKEVAEEVGLNSDNAAKLVIIDSYLNKTSKIEAVKKDLIAKAELLLANQKHEELMLELKTQKIKAREELIARLNAQFNVKYKYSDFNIETFTEQAVEDVYNRLKPTEKVEALVESLATPVSSPAVAPISDWAIEPTYHQTTLVIRGKSKEIVDKLIQSIKSNGFEVVIL